MIFVMSDSALEADAPSTDSFSDTAAAAAAAETVAVFGFVPVSLVAVAVDAAVDEVVEVVDGTELEAVAVVVLAVEEDVTAGTVGPSSVAAAAADAGAARFSLVTTLEYCCISITAASNNT